MKTRAQKSFDIFKLEEMSQFLLSLNNGKYPNDIVINKNGSTMNVVYVEYDAVLPIKTERIETGWDDHMGGPCYSDCQYDNLGGLVNVGTAYYPYATNQ